VKTSKYHNPTGRLCWRVAAAGAFVLLLICGCSSISQHKYLTIFFDGVPRLTGATNNTVAAPVRPSGTNAAPAQPGFAAAPAPPPQPTTFYHPPFTRHQCAECHESSTGQGLRGKPPELCFNCHKDFLAGQKFKHQPVESGDCTSCHDPHQSDIKHLLVKKGNDLCLNCHDDPLAEGKFKHQAVEGGLCLDCHAPHATNFKAILRKSVKDTCLDCHDDPTANKKFVHQPVEDGDCTACHAPHAGVDKNLLVKGGAALCWVCHDNFLSKAKFKHDAVDDCTACHNPHASNLDKLLVKQVPALCQDCHDPKDLQKDKGHQGMGNTSCLQCHDPHVGLDANLLKPRKDVAGAKKDSAPGS